MFLSKPLKFWGHLLICKVRALSWMISNAPHHPKILWLGLAQTRLRHGAHLTFYTHSSLDEAHRHRQWLGQYLVLKMLFSINYFSLKPVVWICLL